MFAESDIKERGARSADSSKKPNEVKNNHHAAQQESSQHSGSRSFAAPTYTAGRFQEIDQTVGSVNERYRQKNRSEERF